MANKIQIRRGTKAKLPTLSAGEPAFCPDTRELFIGTGSGNINMGGSHWYNGTAMSGTSTTTGAYSYSTCPQVKVGDYYLNTSNGYIYECTTAGSGTTARWTYRGSLRGATGGTGGTGPQGTRGTRWNVGTACTGTSTSNTQFSTGISDAIIGDMYLNTSTGYVYKCTVAGGSTAARWVYAGSIKGGAGGTGQRGSNWFMGTAMSDTSTTTGAYTWNDSEQKYVNDMYLNTSNGNIYKCTTAGTGTNARWTYQGCIAGKDAGTYTVTNDTELAAAVSAVNSSSSGGKIVLREGVYNLNATIEKPIVFEGMGRDGATTLCHTGKFTNSTKYSNKFALTFNNIHMRLCSNGQNEYVDLTFEHCKISSVSTVGEIFRGPSSNGTSTITFIDCICDFATSGYEPYYFTSESDDCASPIRYAQVYFRGGSVNLHSQQCRRTLVWHGNLDAIGTTFSMTTSGAFTCLSAGVIKLSACSVSGGARTSISHDSATVICAAGASTSGDCGRITECYIDSFGGDTCYVNAGVFSENIISATQNTVKIKLLYPTIMVGNRFPGDWGENIDCNGMRHIIRNNITKMGGSGLKITNYDSTSLIEGNI